MLACGLLLRLRGECLTAEGIRRSFLDAAVTSGMIYFILFGAELAGISLILEFPWLTLALPGWLG